MKSYDLLARYYDELTVDPQAVQRWAAFTRRHAAGKKLLELGCGSGAITAALIKAGYQVTGLDRSLPMLMRARIKLQDQPVQLVLGDMRDLSTLGQYDTIVCYNDSLNYLDDVSDIKLLLEQVMRHLTADGCFLFDTHTVQRLAEFADPYIEDGIVDGHPYQWVIQSEDEHIYHTWTFYDGDQPFTEQHCQTVFAKEVLKALLEQFGLRTEVYTDFGQAETENGEKWFFVAHRR